ELAHPQREVPVRMDLGLEDLDVARAVHRLDPEVLVLIEYERPIHVLAVLLEVTRALVDLLRRDVRRVDERVAALPVLGAPPVLDLLTDDREVREPQDEAGSELLVDPEELEVAAERAVVAALDLLEPLEARVERGLGW